MYGVYLQIMNGIKAYNMTGLFDHSKSQNNVDDTKFCHWVTSHVRKASVTKTHFLNTFGKTYKECKSITWEEQNTSGHYKRNQARLVMTSHKSATSLLFKTVLCFSTEHLYLPKSDIKRSYDRYRVQVVLKMELGIGYTRPADENKYGWNTEYSCIAIACHVT